MTRFPNAAPAVLLWVAMSAGLAYAAAPDPMVPPKDAVPAPMAAFNFDHDAVGKLPPRFTAAVMGEGPEIHWEVKQDRLAPSAPNVLVQSGKAKPGENFALALLDNVQLDHGEIAVRFKVLSGEEEQAVGIVYRYKDARNYYIIATSAHDDSCAIYQVKKGIRKQIDSQNVIVSPYTWHELHIIFAGPSYTALVDGEAVMGGKDSTFKGPGLVGLWTKSDTVADFDDLRISQK